MVNEENQLFLCSSFYAFTARVTAFLHCAASVALAPPPVTMVPRRKAEGLPLLNPDKESSTPRTPGGTSLRAAGLTCGALFWVVALGVGAALGFFLSHKVGWGAVENARAAPLDQATAAEGHREQGFGPRAARTFESRPKGPQTETICADPPLLSNAGMVLPKCVSTYTLLHELLDGVVLPFWLGPDGLGVDCENGGFENLGLSPNADGVGEQWKLKERFALPHARTAAAFAKLHKTGSYSNATKPGSRERDEMPWFYVHGNSHPTCLEDGSPLALAVHAMKFLTQSMKDTVNGGYFWSVSPSTQLGGRYAPTRDEKRLETIAAVLMAASEIASAADPGSAIEKEAAAVADDAFVVMTSKHRAAQGGGYWPETFDNDWSTLVHAAGQRIVPPRTLSAHLAVVEATHAYVDSLVRRKAGDAKIATAANTLAADVKTLVENALVVDDPVGEVGEEDEEAYEEGEESEDEEDTSEASDSSVTSTLSSEDLSQLATLTPGAGKDISQAVARAAANIGVRVGTNGGALKQRETKDNGLGSDEYSEETETEKNQKFVLAREFYDKKWNPVSALSTAHGASGESDQVTGVSQFDVRFGRNLEMSWVLLEATRAVERAAAAVFQNASSPELIGVPRLRIAELASMNAYAWTFGLRDGGVVPGAGGLWTGVRDFHAAAVDDYSGTEHDKERGEWWAEFESATAALHEWELTGNRAARRHFSDSLAMLYAYFVDWKVEPRAGQRDPVFLSAGLRSFISDEQREAKQPSAEELATKRSPFKDPYRAIRAVLEMKRVLKRGVDPVNAH